MQTHHGHALAMRLAMLAAAGLAAGVAMAQTQTGNVLQRDLNRVKTGPGQPSAGLGPISTSARDIVQEVRLRNAIVTGNAPGGLSFRGDVGYSAPEDFRGSLGSDDTFAFRRDSLPSGVAGLGYRGTESLQYQFAYTTGSSTPTLYTNRLAGGSAALPSANLGPTRSLDASGMQSRQNVAEGAWSTSAANMGTLRSVSAYQSSRLLTPSVVGYRPTFAGLERTSASPLLGVRTVTLGNGLERGAETPRPNAAPVGAPNNAAVPSASASNAAPTNAAPSSSASFAAGETPAPVKELGQPGTQPGAQPGATPGGQPEINPSTQPGINDIFGATRTRLREAVKSRTPGAQPGTQPGTQPDQPGAQPGQPGAQPGQPGAQGTPADVDPYDARMAKLRATLDPNQRRRAPQIDPNTPDDQLTPEQRAQRAANSGKLAGVDQELIDLIRDARITTSTLVMDPQSKDAIDAQMLRGQQLMGEQRYFDAEEQFARVVSFRPGDTAALVGRAHAQLGAGLFLSSALNLREVFANQPETMAVRYQHPAIPDTDRLRVLLERLRTNLQRGRAMNESALLVAYIGQQLDDAKIRQEGLDAMRAVDMNDPLADVLERAWAESK